MYFKFAFSRDFKWSVFFCSVKVRMVQFGAIILLSIIFLFQICACANDQLEQLLDTIQLKAAVIIIESLLSVSCLLLVSAYILLFFKTQKSILKWQTDIIESDNKNVTSTLRHKFRCYYKMGSISNKSKMRNSRISNYCFVTWLENVILWIKKLKVL